MKKITSNTVVTMRYIMKDQQGVILEEALERPPVTYLQGGKHILPVLQQQLEGLQPGDTKMLRLTSSEAGGQGAFSFEVLIDDVRPATAAELDSGYPSPVVSTVCGPGCDCG